MRTLDTQLGQLANSLTNQPQRALPSNTKVNLSNEGKEYYNTIILRNGKKLERNVEKPDLPSMPSAEDVVVEE
ncbi:hypothetical protein PanWU01x14_058150 [Parasponia andersonii]|uniref:Uncharacterized protein n=1 Tax=Parasponia andersonii TaxID=3476 RepID=A0A2P5DJ39_PARAD|nr:hypothetical protein PanWU01x14_058150 [Parasponia andersonii]